MLSQDASERGDGGEAWIPVSASPHPGLCESPDLPQKCADVEAQWPPIRTQNGLTSCSDAAGW